MLDASHPVRCTCGSSRISHKASGIGAVGIGSVAQASESVWQPRFPQVVFFVEALDLSCFNKSGNRKGMWKSIFATSHTDSSACVILTLVLHHKPKNQFKNTQAEACATLRGGAFSFWSSARRLSIPRELNRGAGSFLPKCAGIFPAKLRVPAAARAAAHRCAAAR